MLSNFKHWKWHFLAHFYLKKHRNSKKEQFLSHFYKIWLNALRKTNVLVVWKQSSQSYSHFKTFTPKNGKIYDLTLVPHPMLIKFYFLIFGNVILVHTCLARPYQHFYNFWFLIYNPMSQWQGFPNSGVGNRNFNGGRGDFFTR